MSEFAAKSHISFNLLIFIKFVNLLETIFFDKSILKKKKFLLFKYLCILEQKTGLMQKHL